MTETMIPLPRVLSPARPRAAPPALRRALGAMSRLAPGLVGRMATRLFLRPPRHRIPRGERTARAEAARSEFQTPAGRVQLYRWSRGPFLPWENRGMAGRVLLVHGWGGRATQLVDFIEPLRSAGIEVLSFDAPGHGLSPSSELDVAGLVDVIRALDKAHGPFVGAIGHSMGAGALMVSASEGARLGRIALLGGPSRLEGVVERFARAFGLSDKASRRFRETLVSRVGGGMLERFDAGLRRGPKGVPGLILHDVDDGDVPFGEARALAAIWPEARLVPTAGLGHHRILRDPVVVFECVNFLLEEGAFRRYTPNPFASTEPS